MASIYSDCWNIEYRNSHFLQLQDLYTAKYLYNRTTVRMSLYLHKARVGGEVAVEDFESAYLCVFAAINDFLQIHEATAGSWTVILPTDVSHVLYPNFTHLGVVSNALLQPIEKQTCVHWMFVFPPVSHKSLWRTIATKGKGRTKPLWPTVYNF